MNIENMKKVRQAIIDSPAFDMRDYFRIEGRSVIAKDSVDDAIMSRISNPCGTSACIAGEAALLAKQEYENEFDTVFENIEGVHGVAQEYLDLTGDQSFWLFFGTFNYGDLDTVTKKQAIEAIDFMIDNGNNVDYDDEGLVIN